MTTREAIQAELTDLGHVIAAFESAGLTEWSPEWVALQGLLRRQADLLHQADLVDGKAEVEITLVGGAERDSTIGADFLGDFVSRVQATFGSQFLYTFDLGDDWTHLCTVGPERIDPEEELGIVPDVPLPYFGWGDMPDQYGRRWDEDDGEGRLPRDPRGTDLPPLRPGAWSRHW